MPTANDLNPELPARFIQQALTAPDARWLASSGNPKAGWSAAEMTQAQGGATAILAACGRRVWGEQNVPANPTFPYIVFDGYNDPSGAVKAHIRRDFTARKTAVCTIKRLDEFGGGQGSYVQGATTYQSLMRCLVGVASTPVYTPDNSYLGRIVQSVWRDDHKRSYIDEDSGARITEYGIIIAITYEG